MALGDRLSMSGYKFVLNVPACVSRFNPRYVKAQKFLDSEVLRSSAKYVPYREGNLMKSGTIGTVVGSGEVKYTASYAKKNYYALDRKFSKAIHPQASAQWFEKAKAADKEYWTGGVNDIVTGG